MQDLVPISASDAPATTSALGIALPMLRNLRSTLAGAFLVGLIALGCTYAMRKTYTAHTTFLSPQQQQSAAASAMASLGALSSLVGGSASALRSPADQYISLMESAAVSDRIIDRFGLMRVYESRYRVDARKTLAHHVTIATGKKDSLIGVDVEDDDPQRAAAIANQYVEELRWISNRLALSEAQIRRVFFEQQMKETRQRLSQAQSALQGSGFSQGALQSEPKAAAEEYARVKAELTSAEVTLATLSGNMSNVSPQVQQQTRTVSALHAQLAKLEGVPSPASSDYLDKYRDFKYEETLFDLFSRQYESARLDEARDGTLVQVLDVATPPERKSGPHRATIAIGAWLLAFLLLNVRAVVRHRLREAGTDPGARSTLAQLRGAMRGH